MLGYILNKLGYSFIVILGVATSVFFLFSILPGDPARMMLDQREDSEQLEAIKKKFGFDQPVSTQYFYYLNDLSPISFHSKNPENYTFWRDQSKSIGIIETSSFKIVLKQPYLRKSFVQQGKNVSSIIAETLPNTVLLAVVSIIIAMIIGIGLGLVAAVYQNSILDRFLVFFSTIGMSIPSFFSAILIAWLFGYLWSEYTGLNMSGSLYEIDDYGQGVYIQWRNLILPALTLGIRPLGVITQLTRSSLLEELGQDYIRTARAKGLNEYEVVCKHALRNALNPVITAASGWFASMLAGAVFVEYIFGWNGLGKQIVEALNQLDLPLVMGAVLVIGITFVFINIIVDILYSWLDPRIRKS